MPLANTKAGGGPLYMIKRLPSRLDPRVRDRLDWRIVKSIPGGPKGSWVAQEARYLIGNTKAEQAQRRSPAWFEERAALAEELAEAETAG